MALAQLRPLAAVGLVEFPAPLFLALGAAADSVPRPAPAHGGRRAHHRPDPPAELGPSARLLVPPQPLPLARGRDPRRPYAVLDPAAAELLQAAALQGPPAGAPFPTSRSLY